MTKGRTGSNWRRLKENQRAKHQPCWLCHQPINYNAPHDDDDAFSVDHIKPLSTHPELAEEPTNLASAHLRCNKARGNRTTAPTIGYTSRKW